jgi:hypothetical protein
MSTIKQDMPQLARHEGVWEGWYRHLDPEGKLIDAHRSRLLCRFPVSGEYPYHQSNIYTWEDGKKEVREYPCKYVDGSKQLIFLNDLIDGWAREVPADPTGRTMMLYWQRPDMRHIYFYEMIQTSDDARRRNRVWQWMNSHDGSLFRRTLIEEQKVADSSAGYEDYK